MRIGFGASRIGSHRPSPRHCCRGSLQELLHHAGMRPLLHGKWHHWTAASDAVATPAQSWPLSAARNALYIDGAKYEALVILAAWAGVVAAALEEAWCRCHQYRGSRHLYHGHADAL